LQGLGYDVQLHGVNGVGFESGTDDMSELGDAPVLQDTEEELVWDTWDVTFRDLYILDDENRLHDVYNLTVHSLAVTENFEELRSMFIAAYE